MLHIPTVSLEVSQAIIASMEHDPDYFHTFSNKLYDNNPLFYYMISAAQKAKSEQYSSGYIKGVCTSYVLIEAQMEADAMNEQWG
jgi:hypothetical protein